MNNKKNICKRTAALILFVAILLTSIMVGYTYSINSIKLAQHQNTNRMKVEEFNKIFLYMDISKNLAYDSVYAISKQIEQDIKQTYPDLSVLKAELYNKDYSSVYPIFVRNIKGRYFNGVKNSNNDLFIATLSNIIVDFSYDDCIYSDKPYRSWSNEISKQYNVDLAKNALTQILNQSTDLICWEKKSNGNPNHIKIKSTSYDSLLKVYMREGLDGLKGYNMLIPAYITESGDIFGKDDIEMGIRNSNYKFIVVQELNIYDQIQEHYPELFNDNEIDEKLDDDSEIMNYIYILGIILVITYILFIVLIGSIFNTYILAQLKSDDEPLT